MLVALPEPLENLWSRAGYVGVVLQANPNSQRELDHILERDRVMPILPDEEGRIPAESPSYLPIRQLIRPGLPFTFRTLLHAVGCKLSAIRVADHQECLNAAHWLTHHLDLASHVIHVRRFPESDIVPIVSQMLGIGFTCLLASNAWGFAWDQLAPIVGRGKRFDYRAIGNGVTARFEAKGTRSITNQKAQIRDGLTKKAVERSSGYRPDVHLIVSAFVGYAPSRSRLRIADPGEDVDDWSFTPESNSFYSLRHFARVANFAGCFRVGRCLANLSESRVNTWRLRRLAEKELTDGEVVEIDGRAYVGRWVSSFHSKLDLRPEVEDTAQRQRLRSDFPTLETFQGIDAELLQQLLQGEVPQKIASLADSRTAESASGVRFSMFPDGSVFAVRVASALSSRASQAERRAGGSE
jgi:hypothetical protein